MNPILQNESNLFHQYARSLALRKKTALSPIPSTPIQDELEKRMKETVVAPFSHLEISQYSAETLGRWQLASKRSVRLPEEMSGWHIDSNPPGYRQLVPQEKVLVLTGGTEKGAEIGQNETLREMHQLAVKIFNLPALQDVECCNYMSRNSSYYGFSLNDIKKSNEWLVGRLLKLREYQKIYHYCSPEYVKKIEEIKAVMCDELASLFIIHAKQMAPHLQFHYIAFRKNSFFGHACVAITPPLPKDRIFDADKLDVPAVIACPWSNSSVLATDRINIPYNYTGDVFYKNEQDPEEVIAVPIVAPLTDTESYTAVFSV